MQVGSSAIAVRQLLPDTGGKNAQSNPALQAWLTIFHYFGQCVYAGSLGVTIHPKFHTLSWNSHAADQPGLFRFCQRTPLRMHGPVPESVRKVLGGPQGPAGVGAFVGAYQLAIIANATVVGGYQPAGRHWNGKQ